MHTSIKNLTHLAQIEKKSDHCFGHVGQWSDLMSAHLTFGLPLNLSRKSEILGLCVVSYQNII